MAKLSTSIRTLLAAMLLALPILAGCGGGGGTVPKAANPGPEPTISVPGQGAPAAPAAAN